MQHALRAAYSNQARPVIDAGSNRVRYRIRAPGKTVRAGEHRRRYADTPIRRVKCNITLRILLSIHRRWIATAVDISHFENGLIKRRTI